MKYCLDCGKEIQMNNADNCFFCGYPIIYGTNAELVQMNILKKKIDIFYEKCIKQRIITLEKQLKDEEHDHYSIPTVIYIVFFTFFGFYAIIGLLLWPIFSKGGNIFLELLVICFPFIYSNLNLFTIRGSLKYYREKAKIDNFNSKESILERLDLKWKGSIDIIECYNYSYFIFGLSNCFLILLTIPIYDPIITLIVLLILSLIIDYLIFKWGISNQNTEIFNEYLLIKRRFSKRNEVIKWTDIVSVEIVISHDEYSKRFFKLNIKGHKKPVKIMFIINNKGILDIKKKFIEFMGTNTLDYYDKNSIIKSNEKYW